MRSSIAAAAALALVLVATGCGEEKPLPRKALRADKSITGTSRFPAAIDPKKVGEYPASTKSGEGYFYDEVLEYRVWLSPHEGAEPLAGGSDYFFAFAESESALAFSQATRGAEEPLVLIRQREWINEKKVLHDRSTGSLSRSAGDLSRLKGDLSRSTRSLSREQVLCGR